MFDNRNMILAIAISVVILVAFEFFKTPIEPLPVQQQAAQQTSSGSAPEPSSSGLPSASDVPQGSDAPAPGVSITTDAAIAAASRNELLASPGRIAIKSDRISGSISLTGGRIDDLSLINYRETLDAESKNIVLLLPKGLKNAYYAEFGWVPGANGTALKLPDANTVWSADHDTLSPENPVTLNWDNGEGLLFSKTIAIDEEFMFSITQRVENTGTTAVSMHGYSLVSRRTTPETTGFYILHEGLLGVFNDTLSEVDYDDLQETGSVEQSSTGGWIGITDKYWLTALVPDQTHAVNSRFVHRKDGNDDKYQVDFLDAAQSVAAGGSIESKSHFFAGAKEVRLLDFYEEDLGVARFDLAIDFGWFYFLTKPIFHALLWINNHVGNLGVSILLLTVAIKALFFPLANKSYVAMSKMKKLQPKMVKLREQYGDDKMKLNQEMMALYKAEKANPASGCLPILVQIPVFFALYKVLFVTIEMRHAPFFGWIQDLSAPDPTTLFNLFGLIPWDPPSFLMIGVWPLLMGISMFLQQKLNPQPADAIQAKIFLFMPIMFTFLLASFPAGLVIYWAWNNTLSILQQWVIMRRMGVKI